MTVPRLSIRRRRHRLAALIVFLAAAALMVLRGLHLLLAPRFLAEEGRHFYAYAYHHGFLESLVYVYPKDSYLNFATNLAVASSAHTVALEYAPFVTTYLALLVQLLPLAILVAGDSELFPSWREKAIVGLILSLAPTASGEVWLSSLHSQVFLGLAAFLILFERLDEATARRRWAYRATLVVGGLSGPYTVLLQPAFAARAVLWGGRERWIHAALATTLLIIQIAIVLSHESLHPGRALVREIDVARLTSTISIFQIGSAAIGLGAAERWAAWAGPWGAQGFLVILLLSFAISLVEWRSRRLRLRDVRLPLALALIALMTATSMFSLYGQPGGRYAVLPGYILLFYVLVGMRLTRSRWLSVGLGALLAVSMLSGLRTYRDAVHFDCDGSGWAAAVEYWRKEPARAALYRRPPSKRLEICPGGWSMELDQARARRVIRE